MLPGHSHTIHVSGLEEDDIEDLDYTLPQELTYFMKTSLLIENSALIKK